MLLCLCAPSAQSISQKARCKSSIIARFPATSTHLSGNEQVFSCERPVYGHLQAGCSMKSLNTYLGVMTCLLRAG